MKGYSINDPIVKELASEYKLTLELAQASMNDMLKCDEVSSMTCKDCDKNKCEELCKIWHKNYDNFVLE